MTDQTAPVFVEHLDGGRLLKLTLDGPKGNVLDSAMVAALRRTLTEEAARPEVSAVVFAGAGKNFCFGASVEEHLPDKVARMLADFHDLFRDMIRAHLPFFAAVHGHCLGGGLELAAFCQRVFATEDARLGQPEIGLGVFAPVGSFVLPRRVGQAAADELLLSGRIIGARRAHDIGLVDQIDEDPVAAALEHARTALSGHSPASLRMAVRASRHEYDRAFEEAIDHLEHLYLEELMAHPDAEEGIRAFLEKRSPRWIAAGGVEEEATS